MGLEDYEPRVVPQLLEYIPLNRIDLDDVRLAVEGRVEHYFTSPPGRDLLMEVAREANQTMLPPISENILPKKVQGRGTTQLGTRSMLSQEFRPEPKKVAQMDDRRLVGNTYHEDVIAGIDEYNKLDGTMSICPGRGRVGPKTQNTFEVCVID
ncbi:Transcription initiation factor TFIID subunit 9B [Rhizophlyctis rosea]|nr:Transcription initiation factor TFIID subunit 9B [Rhizophlyctis rosea]